MNSGADPKAYWKVGQHEMTNYIICALLVGDSRSENNDYFSLSPLVKSLELAIDRLELLKKSRITTD